MNSEEKIVASTNEDTLTNEAKVNTDVTVEQKPQAPKKDPQKLYPIRLSKFNSFYTGLVVLAAIGFALAILTASIKDLFWGAVIALVTLFCYLRFSASELKEKLGLSYKTATGSLTVTACRPRYGDILYIPSKLLWYDVERIGDEAFRAKKNAELREIYLPRTLKKIGKDILVGCENLEAVRFEGSQEEWEAIEKQTDFDSLELYFDAVYPCLKKNKKQSADTEKEKN